MKALTLIQPWATLIACGAKTIETRSWYTDYRGPLYIHAGKRIDADVVLGDSSSAQAYRAALIAAGFRKLRDLPRGVIVCRCVLADVYVILPDYRPPIAEQFFGDFGPKRFAWHLTGVQPVAPIAVRGARGLWEFVP